MNQTKGHFIDLHTHSYISDGTYSPTEVVQKAYDIGLYAMALTDHDTMYGVKEAMEVGKKLGIRVIPGVELSCAYRKSEVHILGYFLKDITEERIQAIQKDLEVFARQRDERNEEALARFQRDGFRFKREELYENTPKKMITRVSFANVLVKYGYVESVPEAFDKYLYLGGPYIPEKKTTVQLGIDFFKKHGLFVSLAHPYRYRFSEEEIENLVDEMTRLGMNGLEVYYSTHSAEETAKLQKLAKKNGLLYTGGSDFHGLNKPYIQIGKGLGGLQVPKAVLDDLDKVDL